MHGNKARLALAAVAGSLLLAAACPAASLQARVAQGDDDAEEGRTGIVQLGSSDLELVYDDGYPPAGEQVVGIRFRDVRIPAGASVTQATVQFTAKDPTEGPCRLCIRGQASADPAAFNKSVKNLSRRPATHARVDWEPADWLPGQAGPAQRTPDLAPVVREIVGSREWRPGQALVLLITGTGRRRAFSYDGSQGRSGPALSLEWTLPAAAAEPPAEPHAAGEPGSVLDADRRLSVVVNAAIDNLYVTGLRLVELPLILLLPGLAGIALGTGGVAAWLLRRKGRSRWLAPLLVVLAVLALGVAAWLIDRHTLRLLKENRELRRKGSTEAIGLLDLICERQTKRKAFLFDEHHAREGLTAAFGKVRTLPLIYDDATDVVLVRIENPLAQAFLAVVDLGAPGIDIRLGTTIDRKRLTSEFARENNCTVAVNGEAGRSPKPDSGFGEWIGNLIRQGNVILLKDTDKRPFLSFDPSNRARYSPAAAVETNAVPQMYNVIWGRMDAVLDGQVVTGNWRGRQPRTVMGIDREGGRLYLLVVDGRQPGYSMGLSREEVGRILTAFGAHNAMLCDEGGSTCMFLSRFGGISNVPCDNRGQERPTYTHFGITLRE
ncbi:MAG: phosphodiester glycosidase family protein [Kiritimatiellae bacterium]|nr:phosphodiester glycosidase family protein [Kiritimatiellia bacterium]